MSSRKSRLFSVLPAALLVVACGEGPLPPVLPPPPPPSPPVVSVTISPDARQVVTGTTAQLHATAQDAQGNPLTGRSVAWSSNAETVATVNSTGLVTGVSVGGPVTIIATIEGQIGTAQVTVTDLAPAPGFGISLSSAALSVVQGTSTTTTVKITRSTHFGGVGLYLTGAPTGVSDSFDPTSWPAADSSVMTLTVGAAVVAGIYNLQVNAYDPEQHDEVSSPLTLIVTAPPPGLGYGLSLTPSALSVAPGATSPPTTVDLIRTSFTGNVTLSVDGLPTGVTVYWYPANPTSGSSSRFWLNVAPDAVPGTYPLLVRGVASGLADRTAPLMLTIPVAPFILTLSSSSLSIARGAASPTTTVNVVRSDFTGPVELYVGWYDEDHDVLPPGVTATFSLNPTTGNSAVLTITVSPAAMLGVHYLFVAAEAATGGFCCIPLTLTVTPAAP